MPLARIDILKGRAPEFRVAVGDVVNAAMTSTLDVPIGDRFQIVSEHESIHLVIDPDYLGIERTDRITALVRIHPKVIWR